MEYRHNRKTLIQYVDQCGSFLTIRQDTVHFVHQSAKDYLLSPGNTVIFSPGLGEENKMIAYRCFQYICTDAFSEHLDGRTIPAEELEIITRNTSYLKYPVLHWMDHGWAASLDIAELFNLEEQFFRQHSRLRLIWFHAYWKSRHKYQKEPYLFTVLHLAAYSGLLWLAVKLFHGGYGADVNKIDSTGHVPLHWAAIEGHEAMVKLLLDHNANVDAKDEDEWTALHWATIKEHSAVVQLLLENRAGVEAADKAGVTSLMLAAHYGRLAIMNVLVENGADIEAEDEYGAALIRASKGGHKKVVQSLLGRGARPSALDHKCRKAALHWAAERGRESITHALQ